MTVGQALKKLSRWFGQKGMCPDSPEALAYLNEARELVYESGDFPGTTDWIALNLEGGRFCLPPRFIVAKGIWRCNQKIDIAQGGWSVIDECYASSCCDGPCGRGNAVRRIEARRPYCCKPGKAFSVLVSSDNPADVGVEITMSLVNRGGGESIVRIALEEDRVNVGGIWSDVLSITKPETSGEITIWVNTRDTECFYLAKLSSKEQSAPMFATYEAPGCVDGQYVVNAKKAFQDFTSASEEMDIRSITTMKFALMAVSALEEKDNDAYASSIQLLENSASRSAQSEEDGDPSVSMIFNRELASTTP